MTTPDEDGWIKWEGDGNCPVGEDDRVEVKYRWPPEADEFVIYSASAGYFTWAHDGLNDDIIAYRVIKP